MPWDAGGFLDTPTAGTALLHERRQLRGKGRDGDDGSSSDDGGGKGARRKKKKNKDKKDTPDRRQGRWRLEVKITISGGMVPRAPPLAHYGGSGTVSRIQVGSHFSSHGDPFPLPRLLLRDLVTFNPCMDDCLREWMPRLGL